MLETSVETLRANIMTCRRVISVMRGFADIRSRDISVGTVTMILDGQKGLRFSPPGRQRNFKRQTDFGAKKANYRTDTRDSSHGKQNRWKVHLAAHIFP